MIATLLEKIKGAIRHPECLSCKTAVSAETRFCPRCFARLGLREPYPLVRTKVFETHAATLFNPAIKKLLYSYKFYGQQQLASGLSSLMVQYWTQALDNLPNLSVIPPEKILVTAIPPHTGGRPHLSPLVRPFAAHFGYEFQEDLLHWQRDITPQHKIFQKRGRLENISQSLRVSDEFLKDSAPELVLVLDDLTTTGATLFEATQAFQRVPGYQGKTLGLALCSMPLAFQKHLL